MFCNVFEDSPPFNFRANPYPEIYGVMGFWSAANGVLRDGGLS